MKTMYDKLGDLLSEALKTGQLPKSESDSNKVSFFYVPAQEEQNNQTEPAPEKKSSQTADNTNPSTENSTFSNKGNSATQSEKLNSFFQTSNIQTGIRIPREKIIPQEVQTALTFIGIDPNSSYTDAKKIYREKLMYYHPDRRNANPVLQKIAKEKTERLLKEWEIVENWYENK